MNARYTKLKGPLRAVIETLSAAFTMFYVAAPSAFGQAAMSNMDHGAMEGMPNGGMVSPKSASPTADTQTEKSDASSTLNEQANSQKRRGVQTARPVVPYHRNSDGSYDIPGTGMAMADRDANYMVLFDQLEYFKGRNNHGLAWDGSAWIGRDYNKLWLKSEGERTDGRSTGRVEGLWSHAVAAFWDLQLGIRHDFGQGPNRQWAAIGVQGIAPYWFNVDAAAYLGPSGRTAARAKVEYTFRLSQVAFLTPELETNLYGKADRERGIGSGFSDVTLGLRLRYELRREIAPYIGVTFGRKLGQTADLARQVGQSPSERQVVAGVRMWF